MDNKMNALLKRNLSYAKGVDKDMREKCHEFIDNNIDNYFSRENPIGHITGSMFVMNQAKTKVLLTHHKKFNQWLQLGGHNDLLGQTPLETAIRETFEEGFDNKEIPYQLISFDPLDIHIHNVGDHNHYDYCFSCIVEYEDTIVCSDESHDLKWVSFEEILNDRENVYEDRLRRMVKNSQ